MIRAICQLGNGELTLRTCAGFDAGSGGGQARASQRRRDAGYLLLAYAESCMVSLAHSCCLAFARQFSVLPGIAVCKCLGQVDLDGEHGLVTFRPGCPHPLITMLVRVGVRVGVWRMRACVCVCACVVRACGVPVCMLACLRACARACVLVCAAACARARVCVYVREFVVAACLRACAACVYACF